MRKIGGILFLSVFVYLLTGCTTTSTPASNATANANANAAAKSAAAAPTADALMAMDKQANEAWIKGDGDFFKGFLSDKAVGFENGKPEGKDAIVKMISGVKCDIKVWNLEEPKVVNIDSDNYVLTYKGTFDGSCTDPASGKTSKVPSPTRAATLYTRSGDKWQALWHNEEPIMDMNAPKADDKKSDDTKSEAKKEEPKKDEKAENKPAETTTAAAPARSANTDALVKIHQSGWDSWKAKDAKWFESNTTANLAIIAPDGSFIGNKADVIKAWTTEPCEGVTKVSVSDAYSVSLSPAMELLNLKGHADGKCNGQPNGDLWQTAIYVKDGDAWKLTFMIENLPMAGM